jgi:hypothetical protein
VSTGVCVEHGPWLASDGHCPYCPKPGEHSASREFVGDARAQLWARVYADALAMFIDRCSECARSTAVGVASTAVRDFDEHYLGGKR